MSNNVYFGNSVKDTVSVNVNSALNNLVLKPRSTQEDSGGDVNMINCPAVATPTGPNKGKGVFGTGGGNSNVNEIEIQFETLEAQPQRYEVSTTDLSGRNLFFYIFDGAMVGQDETGRSNGITIVKVS